MSAPLETPLLSLQVAFGGPGTLVATKTAATFPVEVPVLAGFSEETIFPPVTIEREEANCALFRSGELLIGCVGDTIATTDLEACTRRLYQRVLSAANGLHFFRIWNYVPRINAMVNGLEHYRAFCRARSVVFENVFGGEYKDQLSAASAVGCSGDRLSIVFVAGRSKPMHLENPEQIPAYEYPAEHGPRAPSFSRGTVVSADGRDYVFISGTSAIKGHVTVAPGSLDEQIACTLDNLKLVSMASGVGEDLGLTRKPGGKTPWTRHFKIYLRRAEDLLAARRALEGSLLQPSDRVTWLRSDVCRAALNIEIEATLVRAG